MGDSDGREAKREEKEDERKDKREEEREKKKGEEEPKKTGRATDDADTRRVDDGGRILPGQKDPHPKEKSKSWWDRFWEWVKSLF